MRASGGGPGAPRRLAELEPGPRAVPHARLRPRRPASPPGSRTLCWPGWAGLQHALSPVLCSEARQGPAHSTLASTLHIHGPRAARDPPRQEGCVHTVRVHVSVWACPRVRAHIWKDCTSTRTCARTHSAVQPCGNRFSQSAAQTSVQSQDSPRRKAAWGARCPGRPVTLEPRLSSGTVQPGEDVRPEWRCVSGCAWTPRGRRRRPRRLGGRRGHSGWTRLSGWGRLVTPRCGTGPTRTVNDTRKRAGRCFEPPWLARARSGPLLRLRDRGPGPPVGT